MGIIFDMRGILVAFAASVFGQSIDPNNAQYEQLWDSYLAGDLSGDEMTVEEWSDMQDGVAESVEDSPEMQAMGARAIANYMMNNNDDAMSWDEEQIQKVVNELAMALKYSMSVDQSLLSLT